MPIPEPFLKAWRNSGLRPIAWSSYRSARAVRQERRRSRPHWLLAVLLEGRSCMQVGRGPLAVQAPALTLLRPRESFLEDLQVVAGRLWLQTVDFQVLSLPGWPDPLAALDLPTTVVLDDPALLQAIVAGVSASDATALALCRSRPVLDRLLLLFLERGFAVGRLRLVQGQPPRWLEDLRIAIGERLADPGLDLEALAGLAGVTRTHLCREFHRRYGLPPMAWLRRERLTAACRLLRHGRDLSVQAVAARCGYSSPSLFGRHFRRLTGQTPGAFRSEAAIAPPAGPRAR